MLTKIGIIEDIMIYEDIYMEDDKLLMGHKHQFLIASPTTAKIISKIGINKYRKQKLEKLNNGYLSNKNESYRIDVE